MDAKFLMTEYPFLDHMMAETLLKCHENGTLSEHLKSIPEKVESPTSHVITGAVVVTPPEEKYDACV
tara:strand:- start:178 stop:378 length:201 start_codon:yes stop_codon:yes gene_type:complete